MSIVIFSNSTTGAPQFRELQAAEPPAVLVAPATVGAPEAMQGDASRRVAEYWRVPAAADGDEDFLYQPPAPQQQTAAASPGSTPSPLRDDGSEWGPFDNVTVDDIARATPQTVARLFSYSLW